MTTKKFDVTGMTCSACSSRVEKSVSKLEGIDNVTVNLLTNSMKVEFDESKLSTDNIIETVRDAGYDAAEQSTQNNNKKQSNKDSKEDKQADEIKHMKKRFIISLCFLIPLMYISMHHMLYEWFGLPVPSFVKNAFHGEKNAIAYAFTQFLLLLPIMYVNQKYYKVGFKSLIKRSPNMDTLIAIGSGAAVVYGIYVIYKLGYGLGYGNIDLVKQYSMDIYFESAGTILTLITLGKYMEAKSKGKTSEAIRKLIDMAPKTALVEIDGNWIEKAVEDVVIGDIVIVKPGSKITVDGVVTEGQSSVDESVITGESIPVDKTIGNKAIAATINKGGILKIKATKVGEDTTISQIIRLVEEASSSKAPIAKLADKIAGVFVPVVITIAIISTIIWLINGATFEFALSIGIAVLVISCPCALGLATPVAIMVGTGKGAENGILVKSGEALEIAHSINTVVLDKTGTVTEGKPKVTDILTYDNKVDKNILLQIAASIEKSSEHPLAQAIVEHADSKKVVILEAEGFKAVFGRGVCAKIGDKMYFGGNTQYLKEQHIDIDKAKNDIDNLSEQGKTPMLFSDEKNILGVIAVADTVKQNSKRAIQELKDMNINVIMLTGDNLKTATAIQKQLDIPEVVAQVLPNEKEKKIIELQNEGKKVAMVGDGINDAPSLARADVGIAIGAGTDVAIESADIVLVKSDLLDVVTAIKLSKKVIQNIKENLFWAFFYNTIGIPIAAGVLYPFFGLKLNPMIGALAMSFSSVFVVSNALRLKLFKVEKDNKKKLYDEQKNNKNEKENEEMFGKKKYDVEITIEGMSCEHCSGRVEKCLNELDGVEAKVDLKKKTAYVNLQKEVDDTVLKEAIENQGYKVVSVKH